MTTIKKIITLMYQWILPKKMIHIQINNLYKLMKDLIRNNLWEIHNNQI